MKIHTRVTRSGLVNVRKVMTGITVLVVAMITSSVVLVETPCLVQVAPQMRMLQYQLPVANLQVCSLIHRVQVKMDIISGPIIANELKPIVYNYKNHERLFLCFESSLQATWRLVQ